MMSLHRYDSSGNDRSGNEYSQTWPSRLATSRESKPDDTLLKMLRHSPEPEVQLDDHIEETVKRLTSFPVQGVVKRSLKKLGNHAFRQLLIQIIFYISFFVYVAFVLYKHPSHGIPVYIISLLVVYKLLNFITRGKVAKCSILIRKKIKKTLYPKRRCANFIRRSLTLLCLVAIISFLLYDLWGQWQRFISLAGILIFLLGSVCLSEHPRKINWIPVIWGVILQFCLGLFILRWEPGFAACQWFGNQVSTFLSYTDVGSKFVFGEKYLDHPVVFKVMPTLVFFGAIVSILYHLKIMQSIIRALAVVIEITMDTTPMESFAAAAQIFFGQTDISMALRPFFVQLTYSEINAIMTGGFATVSGSILAAYVEFGVSLISSIKETGRVLIRRQKDVIQPPSKHSNVTEALSAGAVAAISMISYVVVNIIAFYATMTFLDTILTYLGSLVDIPDLTFQVICSYIFMPVSMVIGVPWAECRAVGALIGKKIVVNEFLAYVDMTTARKAGLISVRSEVLATYILCSFGSVASLGVNLGCLSSIAPSRMSEFARLSLRALINGNIACFMTACVAGLLYQDNVGPALLTDVINGTVTNTTGAVTLSYTGFITSNLTTESYL